MNIPKGFLLSGVRAGIKTEPKKDLGLIFSEKDAIVGGVFTQNKFPSAHVQYCRKMVPNNHFRALVVNSGNANAATGKTGIELNLKMASVVAEKLGLDVSEVLTSSTGIIGHQLPLDTIRDSLDNLISGLGASDNDFAEAILTTDTQTKIVQADIELSDGVYSVMGFAKGSGMIHPNMATMLAYIITDAPIPYTKIQSITSETAEKSFNRVSVDGDTSTNDSFYLISNNSPKTVSEGDLKIIRRKIEYTAITLAKMIAGDGEGAEHLIEVAVSGAPSDSIARSVFNAIITSSLVKTAVHGKDPNWGRILMAMGNGLQGYSVEGNIPASISIQDCVVFENGSPVQFDEKRLSSALDQFEVQIKVDLHLGNFSTKGWGCDLSSEYVRINADYST